MKKIHGAPLLMVMALVAVLGLSVSTAFAAGPSTVSLGSAANFAVLAKSGISTTGTTVVTGDIGVSPVSATAITGFGLTAAVDTTYSTSPMVTGRVLASNYANPTPATLTTAIGDMQTAYTDAAGRTNPTSTELGAGNIGGLTITPGLYKWGTGVTIPTNVTLSGSATDVWIFQIAQTLSVSSGAKVILSGGAQASNIFWVVGGQVTVGTTAEMSGTILGQTAIVFNTGSKLTGRALAQTAVTLDATAVTGLSAPSSVSTPAPVSTPTPASTNSNSSSNTGTTNSSTNVTTNTSGTTNSPVVTANAKVNCTPGHIFNETTGQLCTTNTNTSVISCPPGHRFNEATGQVCTTPVAAPSTTMPAASAFGQQVRMIAVSMQQGSNGNNVNVLQNFLISQGKGSAAQALANNGATNYFGVLTRAALAEYQAQVGISPALGNFGPITRAHFSSQY